MLSLPTKPESANIAALAQWRQDRQVATATDTIILPQTPDGASGILLCYVNGTLLDPTTVTLSGSTLTLASALSAGDIVVTLYKARGT